MWDRSEVAVPRIQHIADSIRDLESPLTIDDLSDLCRRLRVRGHLSVCSEPYLTKMICGTKTVESRFSKRRLPPFGSMAGGDVLFLKKAAGPLVAITQVEEVEFFTPADSKEVLAIIKRYRRELELEETFERSRLGSKYVTVFRLRSVVAVEPHTITKRDKRAWVVLSGGTQQGLAAR